MNIDISGIAKLYGTFLDVHFSEEIENLNYSEQKIEFTSPVNVSGIITNLGQIFIFEGSVHTSFKTICDRCLEEYQSDLDFNISEKFANEQQNNMDDINVFHGDTIDLKDAILSNIILNLPLRFVCSENCKGLCSVCGNNKNIKKCDCKEDNIDPRLEKLKSLFKIN
ncbi:MAG: DUF177 domain-containing protein [Bacillota bacterium]|nr:DUF177 domain-containing protein [Bacillota bacterium]